MDFGNYLDAIEKELNSSLPLSSNKDWSAISFGSLSSATKDSHIFPLLTPTRALVDLGGKRWRPLLLILCAQAAATKLAQDPKTMEESKKNALHLTPLVEFIHTASLIHDDIEDSSDTRRGKPAAHLTYGLDVALNAASWLYFQASTCITTLDVPSEIKNSLYELYAKEVRRLHLGQAMDIDWHRNKNSCPTQDEYLSMVQCKTGTLSSLAAKTGTMIAGLSSQDVEKAGNAAAKIGAGFQIIDDVINLTTGNPGKKRGDDIVEGKKSLPVLTFINKYGKDSSQVHALTECFQKASQQGISSPHVEKAIGILQESGAIDSAAAQGKQFIQEGCADFNQLFGEENPFSKNITELFMSMIPKNYIQEVKHA